VIRTVILDWGDTVMRNLPYPGPMAHWPTVEAVPGVEQALAALQGRCRLVLATNAADSGSALVRQALARVGLEGRFDAVLTARELGAHKPEPAFFQAVLAESGTAPAEAAMVGDSYPADVAGAKAMGLRAIWFNPGGSPCPGQPLHDAELRSMAGLPAAVAAAGRLPDVAECLALLAEQEAPPPLVQHVQAVAAVAYRLACLLRERGEAVDPLLAHRGGLLHDLDKITSRRLGRMHGELGAEILRARGHDELSSIVERHLIFTILDAESRPTTWEEKLVHYADKVVEGDRVVSLDERLQALYGRYPESAGRMRHCLPALRALEAEICAALQIPQPELQAMLRNAGWG
jgi:HAD superfamily hydrolase (TIGR01509 family)